MAWDEVFANLLSPLFVVLNIVTVWSIHLFLHLWPKLQYGVTEELVDKDLQRAAHRELAISQTLAFLLVFSFLRAAMTSPGSIPDSSEWRIGQADKSSLKIVTREVKLTGERRRCKWCMKYKPDRCHHCRMCQTCVLRMDHHCPWLMNCVGFRNHKFFLLLVNYSAITCSYIAYQVFWTVQASDNLDMAHTERFLLVLCLMVSVIMVCLTSLFGIFHWWLIFSGLTTIEYCEKNTLESAGMKTGNSPYDCGLAVNLRNALGPRMLLWPFPVDPPVGSGLVHEVGDARTWK